MESSVDANATSVPSGVIVWMKKKDATTKSVKKCGRCKKTKDVRTLDDVSLCSDCRTMLLEAC